MRFPTNHPAYLRLLRPHLPVASGSRRCMGSATAAAAQKLPDKTGNPRKKLSKEQRKSLVLDYVHKYRTMNAGKYPSAKETKKQVGGGYYAVRSIIQELQYNDKFITQVDKTPTVGPTADVLVDKDSLVEGGISQDSVSDAGEVSKSELLDEEEVVISAVDNVIVTHDDGVQDEDEGPKSEGRVSEVKEVTDSSALVNKVVEDCVDPTEEVLGCMNRVDGLTEVPRDNSPVSDERSGIASVDVNGTQVDVEGRVCPVEGETFVQDKDTEVAAQDVCDGEPLVRSDLQKVSEDSEDTGDSKRSLKSSEVPETRDLEEKATSKVNSPVLDERRPKDVNGSQGEVKGMFCQVEGDTFVQDKDTELAAQEVRSDLQKVSEDTGDSDGGLKSSEVPETRDLEEKTTSKVDELPSKPADSSEYELKQPTREVVQKSEEDSSLWGNLKSLASNFISLWRR